MRAHWGQNLIRNLVFTANCRPQQGIWVLDTENLLYDWANVAGEERGWDSEANPGTLDLGWRPKHHIQTLPDNVCEVTDISFCPSQDRLSHQWRTQQLKWKLLKTEAGKKIKEKGKGSKSTDIRNMIIMKVAKWLPARSLLYLKVSTLSGQSALYPSFSYVFSAFSHITYCFPKTGYYSVLSSCSKFTFASETQSTMVPGYLSQSWHICLLTLNTALFLVESAIHVTSLKWCSAQPEQPYPVVLPDSPTPCPLFV